MAIATPNGFIPVRTLDGRNVFVSQLFEKDPATDAAGAKILVGDPVKLTAEGQVQRFTAADAQASHTLLGVAAGVFNTNGRVKDNTPTQHGSVSLSADTTDKILVLTDPSIVYRAAVAVSAAAVTDIGTTRTVDFGTEQLVLGRSGARVGAVVDVSGAQAGPFRILAIGGDVTFSETADGIQFVEVVANTGIHKNAKSV